jgi:hypothetical protein
LQRFSQRFYEGKQTGQLISWAINNTNLFEQLIYYTIPDVIVNIITSFGISAVLFTQPNVDNLGSSIISMERGVSHGEFLWIINIPQQSSR